MILNYDEAELAIILAALRYWQRSGDFTGAEIQSIASNDGAFEPLDNDEIDDLCQRMNLDNMPGFEPSALTRLVGALHVEGLGDRDVSELDSIDAPAVITALHENWSVLVQAAAAQPRKLSRYHRLHELLSDMIESGRLTEADIPDDYQALVTSLELLGCIVEEPNPKKPVVAVCIEGGVVNWVSADQPVDVISIDLDTEGCDRGVLAVVPFIINDRLSYDTAYAGGIPCDVAPKHIAMIAEALAFDHTAGGGRYASDVTYKDANGDLRHHTDQFRALSHDHARGLAAHRTWTNAPEVSQITDISLTAI